MLSIKTMNNIYKSKSCNIQNCLSSKTYSKCNIFKTHEPYEYIFHIFCEAFQSTNFNLFQVAFYDIFQPFFKKFD